MNRDTLQGNWKQIKGKVKEKWGEFTDDELDMIEGKRDQIIGKLQEKYGYTREQAEREYRDFEGSVMTGSTRKY
ncbi:MAG: CsbD family protein [Acidobacteria bacterium]|nr:MAG: CsbD family protein [Acidobacteriota bacterium]